MLYSFHFIFVSHAKFLLLRINAACPCCMPIPQAHAACNSLSFHFRIAYRMYSSRYFRFMSYSYRFSSLSFIFVTYAKFLNRFDAACPCCMSLLYAHAVCPCCLSMRHGMNFHFAYIRFASYSSRYIRIITYSFCFHSLHFICLFCTHNFLISSDVNIIESKPSIHYFAQIYSLPDSLSSL